MAYRFRRTVKIGGVRLNVGKKGISSVSIGGRGASATIGKRGVYSNVGLPGTGLSYRKKLGGNDNYSRGSRFTSSNTSQQASTQSIALSFILDYETGETRWTDADGNPISDELIAIARKQNRGAILVLLDDKCKEYNNKLNLLLFLHNDTPSPDTEISYKPIPFSREKPIPPDESKYVASKPIMPTPHNHNFMTKHIGLLGKRRDEANNRLMEEYELNVAKAEKLQQELNVKLAEDQKIYTNQLSYWTVDKNAFDQEQKKIADYVNVERLNNIEAMQDFLEEHLDALEWPLDTNVSFEIAPEGKQVWIDVDLPEIEMMPNKAAKVNKSKLNLTISELPKTQQQQNYLEHIHSIGFRIIGEVFVALPSVHEVIISAYSQRTNRKFGHTENEYLYSAKIQKNVWEQINFINLGSINVVDSFELFNLRRKVSKTGVITPIEPFILEALIE